MSLIFPWCLKFWYLPKSSSSCNSCLVKKNNFWTQSVALCCCPSNSECWVMFRWDGTGEARPVLASQGWNRAIISVKMNHVATYLLIYHFPCSFAVAILTFGLILWSYWLVALYLHCETGWHCPSSLFTLPKLCVRGVSVQQSSLLISKVSHSSPVFSSTPRYFRLYFHCDTIVVPYLLCIEARPA